MNERLNLSDKVMIVAELGNNHEGDFERARDMVRAAADCGVDAVKFQTFETHRFIRRQDSRRFQQLSGYQLTRPQFEALAELARELDLLFISTPLDLESATFLEPLVDAIKIASGDNDLWPLLAHVAAMDKPLIVSTGLCDAEQVDRMVAFVEKQWADRGVRDGQLIVLHCVTSYPVPPEQANLRSVVYLSSRLPHPVGYSDHTLGNQAPLLAVALGARLLEKHFTLDKNQSEFRDHQLSADPSDMKELVQQVRLAESMLGSKNKLLQPVEEPLVTPVRRSIAAATDLPAGHRIRIDDLIWVRPREGLVPGQEERLIGRQLSRDLAETELLTESDLEPSEA